MLKKLKINGSVKTYKTFQNQHPKKMHAQSCLTLCNLMDSCNLKEPSGSSVLGIFQERILGWVAISSSRGPSQLRY